MDFTQAYPGRPALPSSRQPQDQPGQGADNGEAEQAGEQDPGEFRHPLAMFLSTYAYALSGGWPTDCARMMR